MLYNLYAKLRFSLLMLIYSNRLFNVIVNRFFYFFSKSYNKRSLSHEINTPFFSINHAPINFKKSFDSFFFDNSLYGIEFTLKKFSSFSSKINCYIEHGLFLGDHVNIGSDVNFTRKIITFSRFRLDILSRLTDLKVETIGPYIHYSEPFLDKTHFNMLKNELGRVLLFFPAHSSVGYDYQFSHSTLEYLKDYASSFDNIVVSIYYRDITPELLALYRSYNMHVFVSGHKYSPLYLSKLRSVIELSDYCLSEKIGTQVAYSLALDRPHGIMPRSFARRLITNDVPAVNLYGKNRLSRIESENEIYKEFLSCNSLERQLESPLLNYYFGLDSTRTAEELFNAFS